MNLILKIIIVVLTIIMLILAYVYAIYVAIKYKEMCRRNEEKYQIYINKIKNEGDENGSKKKIR